MSTSIPSASSSTRGAEGPSAASASDTPASPVRGESSSSGGGGWRIMPSWASPSKRRRTSTILDDLSTRLTDQPGQSAQSSVGLAFADDPDDRDSGLLSAEGSHPSRLSSSLESELPASDDGVLDEGISMSDTSGKVDFLSSLPLEISLYLLLFTDVQTLGRAMQVSNTWHAVCSDPSIWRDHFHRHPGWQIKPSYLTSAARLALSRAPSSSQGIQHSSLSSPTCGRDGLARFTTPIAARSRRTNTITSEGSIASRIGRRLGDIVSEMGYLALYARPASTSMGAGASGVGEGAGASQTATMMSTSMVPGAEADSPTPPARTRSATGGSTVQLGDGVDPGPGGAHRLRELVSRRHTASAGSMQFGGPLPDFGTDAHNQPAEGAEAMPSTEELSSLVPARRRRTSTANTSTLSPYYNSHYRTPSGDGLEDAATASLLLDWRALYRDRLELERRWEEGRFVKRTFTGHSDSVYCVALKGNVLMSGSRDKTLKVWNADTGRLLRTVEAHTASVLAIQFDFDENFMITGASNGECFVWDLSDWSVVDQLSGHTSGVLDVQYTSTYLASCSKDTSIRVWTRDTRQLHRVLHGHRGPVNAIQICGDNLTSASGDGSAKMWSIASGQVIRVFKGHERGIACLQYNGEVLLTGSNDRSIRVWDPATGECLKVLTGHKDLVRTMVYDPVRKRIFSGSYDRSTRLWDMESANLKMTFKTSHTSLVFDVGMDVSRIVSCSHDQRIVLIDFGEEIGADRFM